MCTPPPMIEDSKECPFPPSPSRKGRHSRRTRERSDGRRRAGTSPNADRQQVCNDTHAFACMHAPITPHTRTNTEAPTVNVHTLIYSWQNKQRQQGTIPGEKKEKRKKEKKREREREKESRRGIGSERERKGKRNRGAGYTSSWPIPLENGTGGCVLPPKRSRTIVMGSSPHGSRGVGSKCYGAGKAWLKLRAVAGRSTQRQTTRRAHQSPTASLKRFPPL